MGRSGGGEELGQFLVTAVGGGDAIGGGGN